MNPSIRIVEVGPRDGLQNEKISIPLEQKIRFVQNLFKAGLKEVELTSFVKAEKIPQLADALELTQEIKKMKLLDKCWILVPNLHGAEVALKLGVRNIAFFTSPSEKFNQKNINCSVSDSLKRIKEALGVFRGEKKYFRGYLSMVFGCPYEGKIPPKEVVTLCQQLMDLGINEISLGDTIGIATPFQVSEIIHLVKNITTLPKLAMHFHDTRGMALVNIYESIKCGVLSFDSSAAGLGGCPYAKGATGNVATEDLVNLTSDLGYTTGIDMKKLYQASQEILKTLNKVSNSKMHAYLSKEFTKK